MHQIKQKRLYTKTKHLVRNKRSGTIMIYLIVGAIISLTGVGFILFKFNFLGIILLLIGVSFGLKGRREIDKKL